MAFFAPNLMCPLIVLLIIGPRGGFSSSLEHTHRPTRHVVLWTRHPFKLYMVWNFEQSGDKMAEKSKILLSLGAALASLAGFSVQGAEAKQAVPNNDVISPMKQGLDAKPAPNAHFQVGEDLLGFVMTKLPDGTIIAGHSSHASHASHSSHSSHASSR